MNPIAVYYESTIIYWNSIIIVAALIAASCLSVSLYNTKHSYGIVMWLYIPFAIATSLGISRLIEFYCNKEKYPDFKTAMMDYSTGGYCIAGVIIGTWLVAILFRMIRLVKHRFELLDAAAPGIAFVLAMIRYSNQFTGSCIGKFKNMSVGMESFVFLFLLAIICLIIFLRVKHRGYSYRIFLTLFCIAEITIDSIRNDNLHLIFYGEKLLDVNKVTGFMGISQFISVIVLLVLFIRGTVKSFEKKRSWIMIIIFVLGLLVAGVSEYLVQRYTGQYVTWYLVQIFGSGLMGLSIFMTYGFIRIRLPGKQISLS